MKKTKPYSYADFNYGSNNHKNDKITSELDLVWGFVKDLTIYLLKIPYYLVLIIFYTILFKFEKVKEYFSKLIFEPFKIIMDISKWFFQAKYTAYLSIFLILIFILQALVLYPLGLMDNLTYSFYDFLNGNFYSIITSIFLHGDIFHLLANLASLIIFGRIVEKEENYKILTLFFFSAIIANLISGYIFYILADQTPSLGASGGIAGLILFSTLLKPFSITFIGIIPMPVLLVGYLIIYSDLSGLINNTNSNTNYLAHLAGYVSVLFLVFLLNKENKSKLLKGLLINLGLLGLYLVYSVFFN